MFYTYVLRSVKNKRIYVGSTSNLKNRFEQHSTGNVSSTKAYVPWHLVEYHVFTNRSRAMQFERFLKTGQQRERLYNWYR